jgi:hypothetical protein
LHSGCIAVLIVDLLKRDLMYAIIQVIDQCFALLFPGQTF